MASCIKSSAWGSTLVPGDIISRHVPRVHSTVWDTVYYKCSCEKGQQKSEQDQPVVPAYSDLDSDANVEAQSNAESSKSSDDTRSYCG